LSFFNKITFYLAIICRDFTK